MISQAAFLMDFNFSSTILAITELIELVNCSTTKCGFDIVNISVSLCPLKWAKSESGIKVKSGKSECRCYRIIVCK